MAGLRIFAMTTLKSAIAQLGHYTELVIHLTRQYEACQLFYTLIKQLYLFNNIAQPRHYTEVIVYLTRQYDTCQLFYTLIKYACFF